MFKKEKYNTQDEVFDKLMESGFHLGWENSIEAIEFIKNKQTNETIIKFFDSIIKDLDVIKELQFKNWSKSTKEKK